MAQALYGGSKAVSSAFAGSGAYASLGASGLAVSGLAANQQTNIEFTTGTVLRPQFEPGAMTAFERRPLVIEAMLCQRYYWSRVSGWGDFAAPLESAYGWRFMLLSFPVEMRIVPTCTYTATTNGSFAPGFPALTALNSQRAALRVDVTATSGVVSYLTSFTASAVWTIAIADVVDVRREWSAA